MSIVKKQGESIDFIAEIKSPDGNLADLTGCSAYCGYAHPGTADELAVHPTPVIDLAKSTVSVYISPAETSQMMGKYYFELKVKDSFGRIAVAIDETIEIKDSIIPIFPDESAP